MTYLYTENYALTLPPCFSDGKGGLKPETEFTWEQRGYVGASIQGQTFVLKLRDASDADRAEAVNRAGWCYVAPAKD